MQGGIMIKVIKAKFLLFFSINQKHWRMSVIRRVSITGTSAVFLRGNIYIKKKKSIID